VDSHIYNERIYANGINGISIITNFCVDGLTRLIEVGFFMMYQQDWIMRQIQGMVQMIARIIFGKDTITYQLTYETNTQKTDLLYKELLGLLNSFKINEAENLLFDSIEINDLNYLKIAVDFYNRLNKLSDVQLENANFSRDEIKTGLNDIVKIFGIDIFNSEMT
jgi:hypothetical protein